MTKPVISGEIQVADLIEAYPDALKILLEFNLPCIVCGEPVWGNLGELCQDHNLSPQDTEKLMSRLQSLSN